MASMTWMWTLCSLCLFVSGLAAVRAADPSSSANAFADPAEATIEPRSLSEGQPIPTDEAALNPDAPTIVGCPMPALLPDGSTASTAPAPNANFRFARSVYLITPAEAAANNLRAGSSPGAIGWRYSTAPGVVATGTLIVYLQNTSDVTNTKSSTWSNAISGMTLVHQSPSTVLPNTIAAFDITFGGGSPFTYTGGGLYVAFDWQWAGPAVSATRVACNGALSSGLRGATSSTSPPGTVNPSTSRPETILTSAVNITNDASVDAVISFGSLAVPFVGPQTIQAVITNRGTGALNNLPVTLDVTGASTATETKTISVLGACGGQAIVPFSPITLGAIGVNFLDVHVPTDAVIENDHVLERLDTTSNLYSYKRPASVPDGGVGFTGANGAFVAKFTTTAPAKITAMTLEFFAGSGTTYKLAIYPSSGSAPGTVPLYLDAGTRNVPSPGPITIALPSPVAVGPGTFYAGIQQTNNTNASLSYDDETPIRGATFFAANSLPPAGWFDFLPGNNSKLNIGVTLIDCAVNAECNDGNACTVDVCNLQVGCTHTALDCNDHNSCTDDSCVPATGCAHGNNSNPCSDGSACTQTDTCQSGACVGSNPVICVASDSCHLAGVCSPPTGTCSNPVAPEGTACTDGSVCTTDACSGGVCVGGPLVHVITGDVTCDNEFAIYTSAAENAGMSLTYSGFAGCHPTAVPVTITTGDRYIYIAAWGDGGGGQGLLHDLAVDGVPVYSGDPRWTVTYTGADQDLCTVPPPAAVAATMVATIPAPPGGWVAPAVGCANPAPGGPNCYGIWGNFPTIDLAAKRTWYDSGAQISPNAPFQPGYEHGEILIFRLDLGTTACDDGNACTQADACQAGACLGSNAVTCTASDQCHLAGQCNPATGACSDPAAPNGTACTDGNPCTTDACTNGSCVGSVPIHAITGDVTCDNEFAIYTAATESAGMAVTYTGFAGCHPASVPVTFNTSDRYLYIAAWGDGLVGQGLLHDLSVDGVPVYSGDPRWKVAYSNSNQDACSTPPPAAVATAMAATIPSPPGGWVAPAVGCANPAPGGPFCYGLWGHFPAVDLTARRTWYNSGEQISANAPFEPGYEHHEILIFRLDLGAAACDDGSVCTTGDTCVGGSCQPGGAVVCNDGNVCTNDGCNPATGCVYANNAVPCNDASPCTIGDVCGGGTCGGTPITAPPETQNLTAAANKTTYNWSAAIFATQYDVVRGAMGALPVGPGGADEFCFGNLLGNTLNDPAVPVPGAGFWYLSRGENTCGVGTFGTRSNGAPRTTTTCP